MSEAIYIVADSSVQSVEVVENQGQPIAVVDPSGGYGLDGVPVLVRNPRIGDVISFNGAVFANRAQEDITDGGNF